MTRRTALLWGWFVSGLLWRAAFPALHNPLDFLVSDAARHWDNGRLLLHPTLMGSIDPKAYQVYLFALGRISRGDPSAVALCTGLLSLSMAYFWWRFCREIMPPGRALFIGGLIAWTPSLWVVYGFFMNETLLLALLGLAFWQTARCARSNTPGAFVVAVLAWILATYTRVIVLPMAIVVLVFLLYRRPDVWRRGALVAGVFLALGIPASWHSAQQLHLAAPFGYAMPNAMYRRCGGHDIQIGVPWSRWSWIFSAGSYYLPPLAPFSDWQTTRHGTCLFMIDTRRGTTEWEAQYAAVPYGWSEWERDLVENLVFLLFGSSWPDADQNGETGALTAAGLVNYQLRWLWPLLLGGILFAVATGVRHVTPEIRRLVWLNAGMIVLLLLQQTSVMDARFRKPIEPLLLICAVELAVAQWRRVRREPLTGATAETT